MSEATLTAPMEVEITEIPPLAPGERSLIDMHSLLNVVNVLNGELVITGLHLADDPDLLGRSLKLCQDITAWLREPEKALDFAARVADFEQEILNEIVAASAAHPVQAAQMDHRETVDNIRSVFRVLDVRAREVLAQMQAPGQWVSFTLDGLRKDFLDVFAAFEKNSKGRYRIIYNLACQQPNDYYIDFAIESSDRLSVSLPILFKDVMRDLIANARKYTAPGGTINIGLYETDTELRFVVQDTGCGIPAAEIRSVVGFGRRGSNVAHLRTMGGGFGLTKAFLVTKQFGGRMWIKSEEGAGTRITLTLPRPV